MNIYNNKSIKSNKNIKNMNWKESNQVPKSGCLWEEGSKKALKPRACLACGSS